MTKITIEVVTDGYIVKQLEFHKDPDTGILHKDIRSNVFIDLCDMFNFLISEMNPSGSYDEENILCMNIPGRKFEGKFMSERVKEDRELAMERYRLKEEDKDE